MLSWVEECTIDVEMGARRFIAIQAIRLENYGARKMKSGVTLAHISAQHIGLGRFRHLDCGKLRGSRPSVQ